MLIEAVLDAIRIETGIVIPRSALSISSETVSVRTKPHLKAEILMKEESILARIKSTQANAIRRIA